MNPFRNYLHCPHCNGTADRFIGEREQFKRLQYGIACDGCPACVMLITTLPNQETPTDEEWAKAEAYWNKRW